MRETKRMKKFPEEIIVSLENENSLDEYLSLTHPDHLEKDSREWPSGEQVAIYRRVGFKTFNKTLELK